MLEKIRVPGIKKVVSSVSKMPFKDHIIDAVIASHVLEHLPKLSTDLKEIKRVLKKDGKFIVVLPCDPGWLWRALTYFSPSRRRLKKAGLDYDEVMKHEHVNSFEKCLKEIKQEFLIKDETYYPSYIKNYHLNILCCLTLIPR